MGGTLGSLCNKGLSSQIKYVKLEPEQEEEKPKTKRSRPPAKIYPANGRWARLWSRANRFRPWLELYRGKKSRYSSKVLDYPRPTYFLYDMEGFRSVDDHEDVRQVLQRRQGWVQQSPIDGYLEYWYFFPQDVLMHKYPAARARLPWPRFDDASPEVLQSFVHVVNRVAHGRVITMLSRYDMPPLSLRQQHTQRQQKLCDSMHRSWEQSKLPRSPSVLKVSANTGGR